MGASVRLVRVLFLVVGWMICDVWYYTTSKGAWLNYDLDYVISCWLWILSASTGSAISMDIIHILWMYPHFVDIIHISWIYWIYPHFMDIICIGHITSYLTYNVQTVFSINSSSVSDWCTSSLKLYLLLLATMFMQIYLVWMWFQLTFVLFKKLQFLVFCASCLTMYN